MFCLSLTLPFLSIPLAHRQQTNVNNLDTRVYLNPMFVNGTHDCMQTHCPLENTMENVLLIFHILNHRQISIYCINSTIAVYFTAALMSIKRSMICIVMFHKHVYILAVLFQC